jgi:CheY-like chemotaxis protein
MSSNNILLAEDDFDDYKFFVEAFEKISCDHSFTRAKNGLECITYLKTNEKPNIVFLDLNIPIKNGLECLKFIKDQETLMGIPVVIYSTSHYIKHIDAAFKGGAHYYIVKPSNENELVEILATVLSRLNEHIERPSKENFVVRNIETANH